MCTCCMMIPYILRLPLSSIFNFLSWFRKATKNHRRTHSIMETKWKRKRCEKFFSLLLNAPHMTDVSIYKNALYPFHSSHLPALYPLFTPLLQIISYIHVCYGCFTFYEHRRSFLLHLVQLICFVFYIRYLHERSMSQIHFLCVPN